MENAEWNAIRENLEECLIGLAQELIEHTGCASFHFPATDSTPEVKVTAG